jgi:hypothetical protein
MCLPMPPKGLPATVFASLSTTREPRSGKENECRNQSEKCMASSWLLKAAACPVDFRFHMFVTQLSGSFCFNTHMFAELKENAEAVPWQNADHPSRVRKRFIFDIGIPFILHLRTYIRNLSDPRYPCHVQTVINKTREARFCKRNEQECQPLDH